MNMSDIPVGIDLGTTYSCVAVYRGKGAPEVIPNQTGKRTTPSYVAYVDDKRLVGDKAKSQASVNPENTIFDVKRLIGRRFMDQTVQDDIKIWPFQVIDSDEGYPKIKVTIRGREKLIHPIEISAAVLSDLKASAERHLGQEVRRAVVTVPSYFNDHQREDTKTSATLAGLQVLRIVNEPTAAALAFGLNLEKNTEQIVLIFDFGGGTFDVTVMLIKEGSFTVQSTSGDTHLGGEDFTGRLVEHCVKDAKTHLEIDVSNSKRALGRLRVACEEAKLQLSDTEQWDIEVPNLLDNTDFLLTVSVGEFEKMCEDLFARLTLPLERALQDADLKKSDVKQVALVGGASRMPHVRSWLRNFFDGLEPVQGVNADEAVACGAAMLAFQQGGSDDDEGLHELNDVLPLSLGVSDVAGDKYVVIKRNTTIPFETHMEYTTYYDNQGTITFDLYEGERPISKENNLLGSFKITDLALRPQGQVTVDVTIKVDSDGLCVVTGVEHLDGEDEKKDPAVLKIVNIARCSLTQSDIDRMILEARLYTEDDRRERERLHEKFGLESMCFNVRSEIINHCDDSLGGASNDRALDICNASLDWLASNKDASVEDIHIKKIEVKRQFDALFAEEDNDAGVY